MAGEAGALGPLCRGEAPITRAGLGDDAKGITQVGSASLGLLGMGPKGPNPTGPEPRQTHGDHP